MILKFTDKQVEFLNEELSLNVKPNIDYEFKKEKIDAIREYCMDVEVEEIEEADNNGVDENIRGLIAADIYDLLTAPNKKIQRVD